MYNCHLDTQPGDLGPLKGCYSVTSTERSFCPRSKKRLETSKHPLNGGSGIFLSELIGINRGMIQKVGYATPKVTKYQRCHYIIQNHQSTIKIDKININLLVVCVNIVEFNSISIPTCFMLCIINQETCFLNQDACFLNQEGRRQFLISFVSERD